MRRSDLDELYEPPGLGSTRVRHTDDVLTEHNAPDRGSLLDQLFGGPARSAPTLIFNAPAAAHRDQAWLTEWEAEFDAPPTSATGTLAPGPASQVRARAILEADDPGEPAEHFSEGRTESKAAAAVRRWNEEQHPRVPKGSGDASGEFVGKPGAPHDANAPRGLPPADTGFGPPKPATQAAAPKPKAKAKAGGAFAARDERRANVRDLSTANLHKLLGEVSQAMTHPKANAEVPLDVLVELVDDVQRELESRSGGHPVAPFRVPRRPDAPAPAHAPTTHRTVLPAAGRPDRRSAGRSPQGNLRNFKRMSDEKLADVHERLRGHPDTEARQAVDREIKRRLGERGKIPASHQSGMGERPPRPAAQHREIYKIERADRPGEYRTLTRAQFEKLNASNLRFEGADGDEAENSVTYWHRRVDPTDPYDVDAGSQGPVERVAGRTARARGAKYGLAGRSVDAQQASIMRAGQADVRSPANSNAHRLAAERLAERDRTHGPDRALSVQDKIDALLVGGLADTPREAREMLIDSGEIREAATAPARPPRPEDDPAFNWRKQGGRRGVILKDGRKAVVTAEVYDRLKRQGAIDDERTPRLRGDIDEPDLEFIDGSYDEQTGKYDSPHVYSQGDKFPVGSRVTGIIGGQGGGRRVVGRLHVEHNGVITVAGRKVKRITAAGEHLTAAQQAAKDKAERADADAAPAPDASDAAVSEAAWDEAKHPRDRLGRWRPLAGAPGIFTARTSSGFDLYQAVHGPPRGYDPERPKLSIGGPLSGGGGLARAHHELAINADPSRPEHVVARKLNHLLLNPDGSSKHDPEKLTDKQLTALIKRTIALTPDPQDPEGEGLLVGMGWDSDNEFGALWDEFGRRRLSYDLLEAARVQRMEDHPDFNWRRDGNGKRGVVLKDGRRVVVDGAQFDRLRAAGKIDASTPRLRGDKDTGAPSIGAAPQQSSDGRVKAHTRVDPRTGKQTQVREFIRRGQSGAPVQAIQHRVGATPDGRFGAQTEAKVRAFQKAHGLVVDGIVGKQTASAMLGNKAASKVHTGAIKADQYQRMFGGKPRVRQTGPVRAGRGLTRAATRATGPARAGGGTVIG